MGSFFDYPLVWCNFGYGLGYTYSDDIQQCMSERNTLVSMVFDSPFEYKGDQDCHPGFMGIHSD